MKDQGLALGTLILCSILFAAPANGKTATAELINSQGQPVGSAKVNSVKNGVQISLTAKELPPGVHAMHIHSTGSCQPPDFSSAGPHFNPEHKEHGTRNPKGPHAGDLPNITVGADGTVHVRVVVKAVTLGQGKNSLLKPGGTSIVIHAGPDDEMSNPAGNAGARIACGVIKAK